MVESHPGYQWSRPRELVLPRRHCSTACRRRTNRRREGSARVGAGGVAGIRAGDAGGSIVDKAKTLDMVADIQNHEPLDLDEIEQMKD